MSNEPTRAIDDEELLDLAERALESLDAGCLEVDLGYSLGIEKVAAGLRRLLSSKQGNDLLGRVAELKKLDLLFPPLSINVKPSEPLVMLRIGAMPESSGSPSTTLDQLREARCLLITHESVQYSYTWMELIGIVAEKLGPMHGDPRIQVTIDEMMSYQMGGVPVLRYMLRVIAAAVSEVGADLLSKAGRPTGNPSFTLYPQGQVPVSALIIKGSLDKSFSIVARVVAGTAGSIAGYTPGGRIAWLFDPPSSLLGGGRRPATAGFVYRPPGRNEPCLCGSGFKYRRCCGAV